MHGTESQCKYLHHFATFVNPKGLNGFKIAQFRRRVCVCADCACEKVKRCLLRCLAMAFRSYIRLFALALSLSYSSAQSHAYSQSHNFDSIVHSFAGFFASERHRCANIHSLTRTHFQTFRQLPHLAVPLQCGRFYVYK